MIPFVAIEDGKDVGLMTADQFGEFFRRAVSDSLQQFGIVAHGAFVLKSTLQLVGVACSKASQRLSGPARRRGSQARQGWSEGGSHSLRCVESDLQIIIPMFYTELTGELLRSA